MDDEIYRILEHICRNDRFGRFSAVNDIYRNSWLLACATMHNVQMAFLNWKSEPMWLFLFNVLCKMCKGCVDWWNDVSNASRGICLLPIFVPYIVQRVRLCLPIWLPYMTHLVVAFAQKDVVIPSFWTDAWPIAWRICQTNQIIIFMSIFIYKY